MDIKDEDDKLADGNAGEHTTRKRMKKLYKQIREQMEFYFSDANLNRDRFIKKRINETTDGFLSLEMFSTFNKISQLTKSVEDISKALKRSKLLTLNEDRTMVKRTRPITKVKDADERTVYTEYLPPHADHIWLRRIFSECGPVVYVSIPRYKSTGDMKGFAFIEFETAEGAMKACQVLNNPPITASDKPGLFPKTNKNLQHLEKTVIDAEDGNQSKSALEHNEDETHESKSTKKSRKRKQRVSECSTEGEISKDFGKDHSADKNTTDESSHHGGKKIKMSVTEGNKVSGEQDKLNVVSGDNQSETKAEDNLEGIDSADDKKDETNLEKKKKKNRKKKKKNDSKEKDEIPELRVISKKEWLVLKSEYLALQKQSMSKLKQSLFSLKEKQALEAKLAQQAEEKKNEMQFIPDVIVRVVSDQPCTRKDIKEQVANSAEIAYIDYKDGLTEGHIRCHNSPSATKLSNCKAPGLTFVMLAGEEERIYWDKILADRQAKLSSKVRTKKRGTQKLLEKAQNRAVEVKTRKHIHFEDD